MFSLTLILIALPVIHALARPHESDVHDHPDNLPISPAHASWSHPKDHPVYALFKLDDSTDNSVNYASVGSTEWLAGFPPAGLTSPDPSTLPAAWVNALNSALADGKIPNISVSSNTPANLNPVYPGGLSPTSPQICSGTYQCRIPGDIWDAPDGVFASAFDDGPTPSTTDLVQFLQSNNEITTHFMIGSNIIYYPAQFMTAFQADHDIAVHTWTHPYMTTKNNLQVVGELGWAMQLVANSTGGRLPKFWRPPYGDTDVRVSAIAREVFGLQTVVWNHDSTDWSQNTTAPIVSNIQQFLSGPKSPGLIVLEHELRSTTVDGFMLSYSMIASNGWKFQSLAQVLGGGSSYANAQSSSSSNVIQEPIVPGTSSTLTGTSTAVAKTTSSSRKNSGETNLVTSCLSTMLATLFSLAILLSL